VNLAELSIKRPVFIVCTVIVMIATGLMSLKKLPVNLFPDVTFPIVTVSTVYPGAAPKEVETLVSKVIEEKLSTLTGLKSLKSINKENISIVVAEFVLETDVKYAEQQVRDKVSSAKRDLPDDVEESRIRRVDPADQPILSVAITADLPAAEMYDLADLKVKPRFEQVNNVGLVEIYGGRKREIHVELDRAKLKQRELSATIIAQRIGLAGANVPAGSVDQPNGKETVFRTTGEFQNVDEISNTLVNFLGNEVPVTISNVGVVKESLEDEESIGYVNGKKTLVLQIYRQSGANTIEVAKMVKKRIEQINLEIAKDKGSPRISLVRDGAKAIEDNVFDVYESIGFGIILTVIVVLFFLGSVRSTIITGLAIPNSLIGALVLVAAFGFSINIMTLLALSLSIGLLIDDAIVVRENIFRHVEMGKDPKTASLEGTKEVSLAVIATAMTIIAVFGPIAFLSGVVGQFFKEFGLTVCFIMIISTYDALTIAPMMSTYFAGSHKHGEIDNSLWGKTFGRVLAAFSRFQDWLEIIYVKVINFCTKRPYVPLLAAVGVFVFSLYTAKYVAKTFLPPQDNGEMQLAIDLPPGTSLSETDRVAKQIDEVIRSNKEVSVSLLTVGNADAESQKADFYIRMVPPKQRKGMSTPQFKDKLRAQMKQFAFAKPKVKDFDAVGGGERPFTLLITGNDNAKLETYVQQVYAKMKDSKDLADVDTTYRPGKPEFQVVPDRHKAELLGVPTNLLGDELRTLVEGKTPAVFRRNGEEYDIRVRLKEDQRDLQKDFDVTYVPNINNRLIKLSNVANPVETTGPSTIYRVDRTRYYEINADVAAKGGGLGGAVEATHQLLGKDMPTPPGISYRFSGQAENFRELVENMVIAMFLGILFIYLVLASLYESFITPLTILLVVPLAISGALFALFLTGAYLDLFSMIGCIMLIGVSTKNSILIVDATNQRVQAGMDLVQAVTEASKTRLRPILMTSFALIAGMLPIAIGLNEASAQRTGLGIAVIGGAFSSTLLSLVVVPAAYSYIERFRRWSLGLVRRLFSVQA
jgi:HAE1 family hydrophobic/amphiphilic exporter-1